MNSTPKFSVILPVFNSEQYLKQTIESILSQSFSDFELLIIDDGSTDLSLEIIKKFKENDKRIKIFEQKNSGPGVARNTGINNASGELICFIDSDDFYESILLETVNSKFNTHDIDSLIFTFKDVNELNSFQSHVSNKGEVRTNQGISKTLTNNINDGSMLFQEFIKGKFVAAPWNKVFKRSLFNNHELRFNTNVHHQDFGLTPRLIGESKKVFLLHQDLYNYRRRDNSVTYSCTEKHAYSIFTVMDELISYARDKNLYNTNRNNFLILLFKQAYHNFSFRKEGFTSNMVQIYLTHFQKSLNNLKWDKEKDNNKEITQENKKLVQLLILHPLVKSTPFENKINNLLTPSSTDANYSSKATEPVINNLNLISILIRKRKIAALFLSTVIILSSFVQLFISFNLLTLVVGILSVVCIYLNLCLWNDLKDTSVDIDKMNSSINRLKNALDIKSNSTKSQVLSNNAVLITQIKELIEEAQYDNRRQFEKFKRELK